MLFRDFISVFSASPQQNISTLASDSPVTSTTSTCTSAESISKQKSSEISVSFEQTAWKKRGLEPATETKACIGGQEHHETAADGSGQVGTTSAVISVGDQHISTTTCEGSSHQITSTTTGENSEHELTTAPGNSEKGDSTALICVLLSANI